MRTDPQKQAIIDFLKGKRDTMIQEIIILQQFLEYGNVGTLGAPQDMVEAQINAMRSLASIYKMRIRAMGDLT
jgi:H2-forming N5,N10-methylenetetrahydromethanopterin dehydrogenase-like enzyme